MIKSIEFSNYRIFEKKQKLKIAPITMIFGKNNSGKSALLKLPLLIESAFNTNSAEVFRKKGSNDVTICDDFRDVVYKKGFKSIGIDVQGESEGATISLNTSFFVDSNLQPQTILDKWNLSMGDSKFDLAVDESHKLKFASSNEEVTFDGFKISEGPIKQEANAIIDKLNFIDDYIGPFRELPKRDFRIDDNVDGRSGHSGINNYSYLVKDSLNVRHPLLDKVSYWYERTFEGWKIEIDKTKAPVYYINLNNNGISNNILDTGAGIAQSLPIVIAACRDYQSPVLITLEEPETHLHPAAHGELAQLIAEEAIEFKDKRFLIETHSLNFIIRMRAMVASGKLRPEDVAMYFVDFDSDSVTSNLKEVTIEKNGNVKNWPGDKVFNETYSEVIRLRDSSIR